jgi:ribosomal protein S15P/S13E
MKREQTLKHFAANDKDFHEACKLANVDPTRRQASKFKNKKGLAYKVKAGLVDPREVR